MSGLLGSKPQNPHEKRLTEFVAWVDKNIVGDEKGEAQIYLDHLFRAFGHAGVREAGGQFEVRIRKSDEDGGGIIFADLVWKPIVLIEMKKRGADLQKHYSQIFRYWERLVPGRPQYVVLCNFDEFRIYDFNTQLDTPVDVLPLSELPERWEPLAFLLPGSPKPNFLNDRVAVTQQAADRLATCFRALVHPSRKARVDQPTAQRFVLQMLVALFSEDIGLLEKRFVTNLLDECHSSSDTHDLIGGLFAAMNLPRPATGGRFKEVPYFNGGLFANPARIELMPEELELLRDASKYDWKMVQPEIFGTLFQHSMGAKERRAMGAHFTHPADIMKIVGPTIVDPWLAQIEEAKTLKRLRKLVDRMGNFTVLDPACGSGNFLFIAYRAMKRLEARLFARMSEFSSEDSSKQVRLSFLSARNFYGIDIEPFAVELAKVTMMIARKLSIDELHIAERALPLDNLDANFIAGDALIAADGSQAKWPKVDVIIGNPPFLGAKLLKPERGPDYVNAVRKTYPEIPGMADYCVYWFNKAHTNLPKCTKEDPVAGRAGLVGTQNIRNNQSRVGGLDQIAKDGTIIAAVDNQPWQGEANVHVSIANWMKTQDLDLVPKRKQLWFKVDQPLAGTGRRKRGTGSAEKSFEIDFRECDAINSALSDMVDVSGALVIEANTTPQRVFQGITPGHAAFVLTDHDRGALIDKSPKDTAVIYPYLIGDEVLSGTGVPERFVIDFQQRSMIEAQEFSAAFARIKNKVLPDRIKAADEGKDADGKMRPHHRQFLEKWWKLSWDRAEMIREIQKVSRYLVCSRVTKRPIFAFVSRTIRPGDALQVFLFEDDYSFGILQSNVHWLWFTTKCSKLEERFRYTPDTVFDTFPWPQTPTEKQIVAVANAAVAVRRERLKGLTLIKGGLRELYRLLELPGKNPLRDAHAGLDAAVVSAYGFNAKKDLLKQIVELNLALNANACNGRELLGPGLPKEIAMKLDLVTDDCVVARAA